LPCFFDQVQKEDLNNPEILGQIPSPTAQYL
jgi:hypothetical protein